jgi:4'-phosphopantetheinyl transferase
LIQDAAKLSGCKAVLSATEMAQYHRFHSEQDKHSYLVSHALLRKSLAKYADVDAAQWQFVSGEHGKPELAAPSAAPGLCFNLTHTAGLSACVITLNRRCGIDAENTGRNNKLAAVAQRMFAKEELAQLDENNIASRFYYFWTLREAYVKARGSGLAGSSKDFYFDVDANNLSAVLHCKNDSAADGENWHFSLLQPTAQHVLTVAVDSIDAVKLVVREWLP